ncbi:MAG: hypothetical protein EU541_07005 [Promethearchaeota archaeon]|nr:MAG: hypothetical protein EU541_07005 [Candidatus Lokiarchaeota archaeon]
MDKTESMSREALFEVRKAKIKTQIAAATRILTKDIEPLELADKFIHQSLQLLKEGISQQHPNFTEKQVIQRMRTLLSLSEKIRTHRKRRKSSWQK